MSHLICIYFFIIFTSKVVKEFVPSLGKISRNRVFVKLHQLLICRWVRQLPSSLQHEVEKALNFRAPTKGSHQKTGVIFVALLKRDQSMSRQ